MDFLMDSSMVSLMELMMGPLLVSGIDGEEEMVGKLLGMSKCVGFYVVEGYRWPLTNQSNNIWCCTWSSLFFFLRWSMRKNKK